ncbi:MAG: hypothetical protein CMJ64_21300 [Planctomycetaceae bacterium]|nr:hypothetical protein [Planctomycetaceae bacterium]
MSDTALRLRELLSNCDETAFGKPLARELRGRGLIVVAVILAVLSFGRESVAAPLDQQARQEAIDAIPFAQLSEVAQAKLWGVVSKPSIYRQLPTTVVEADPEMYLFLVRYPEVIVNMWQLMGVTKVQLNRTSDYTFDASDGAGTVCNVELIYGDQNTHVFYAQGTYEGALLRKLINGHCVMVLRSNFARTEDQHIYVTSRLDMFVQFDNVGAEILAKTLHPLVGKSADHNFSESTRFLGQVSQAAATRPAGVQQLARRLENIKPRVRGKFVEIAAQSSQRAALCNAGHVVWGSDAAATPVSIAPVVTPGAAMEGASSLFRSPSRKPLRLRR